MRNLYFFFLLLPVTFRMISQETPQPEKTNRHEITFNFFYPIVFKSLEGSYEYLIKNNRGIGISMQYADYQNIENQYMISPYARHYFGNHDAKGFFMELFLSANGGRYKLYQDTSYWDEANQTYIYDEDIIVKNYSDFAIGIGAGLKLVSSDHFIGMVHGGVARNMFTKDYPVEVIGKGGISLGFRF